MLLLAADTSGKGGSIALADCDDQGDCHVKEVVPLLGGTFSAQLVPQIAALLSKHGLARSDIGGFAVASGPGSFTGLRVGLAAIKALAEVLRKPIAAVSLLEAIADESSRKGQILSAIDAGRGEIFAGRYEILPSRPIPRLLSEELMRIDLVCAMAPAELVVTPDDQLAEVLRAKGARVELVPQPRSDVIARLGGRKIRAGITVPPEELTANYIRRSDAEISVKS